MKDQNQIQEPPFSKFPAYGVFLLKRPKGTKSRRWTRGLPNAQREYPQGTHVMHCPASEGGYRSSLGNGIARSALGVLAGDVAFDNRMAI